MISENSTGGRKDSPPSSCPWRGHLTPWDRHRGNACDDAAKTDPGRRRELLAEKYHADGNPDRHAQIGLRRRADRAKGLDQPEIDHEGERGGEYRKAKQRHERTRRGRKRPGLLDREAYR